MGGTLLQRNERNLTGQKALWIRGDGAMVEERGKISEGQNDRPLDETIAATGPGIPDDSLAPGETELPKPATDEEVERAREALGAPEPEVDTLPLEGE